MAQTFRFLEDIVIADVAFEACGDTLEEVFQASTQAMIEIMVDPETVSSQWRQELHLRARDTAALLFDWLSHLVFLKDAQSVVFREARIRLLSDQEQNDWSLHADIIGESINPTTQSLRSDVKAVTKHQYSLTKVKGRWMARVVLDL